LAILLVTWGIVPTQAGIFSTRLVSRSQEVQFDRSTAFVPASKQEANMTYQYAESVYGIAVLNETLTSYMARNYTLAPFRPSSTVTHRLPDQGNWTAETWMYSLDMHCEPPVKWVKEPFTNWVFANSSNGCSYSQGLNGNLTFGMVNYFFLPSQSSFVYLATFSTPKMLCSIYDIL
jgi:hypothetical protein